MHKDQEKLTKGVSEMCEDSTKGIFERLGLVCDRLDTNAPDYLVCREANNYRFLCEVKSILSGGWSKKTREHYSVLLEPSAIKPLDPNTADTTPGLTVIPQKDQLHKLEHALGKSCYQRKSLITANASSAQYAELPFVVALYLYPGADLWPDELQLVLREYPEISAILIEAKDCQLRCEMSELSEHDLIDKLEIEASTGEAQFERGFWDTPHWHYIVNYSAMNRFDARHVGVCPHDHFYKA